MNAAAKTEADRKALSFAMALSLAIGLFMAVIKVGAYLLTGSAAILSDAAESVVHMAAVIFAAYSLTLSYKPPDESHLYGHAKISFFSAGFEGAMIILAALFIIYESVHKWLIGPSLEKTATHSEGPTPHLPWLYAWRTNGHRPKNGLRSTTRRSLRHSR